MKPVILMVAALMTLAGCASTASVRPGVETDTSGPGWDFSAVYDGWIYIPSDAHEVSQKQEEATDPMWRYVARERLTNPTHKGLELVSRSMNGFTCPVTGRVLVAFLVSPTGDIIDPRAAGRIHPACDAQAVRAIHAMSFTPAVLDGEQVATMMTLPINFR